MLNRQPSKRDALRAALGPTEACPPLEELERFASREEPAAPALSGHVQSCPYCQTEVLLLQEFLTSQTGASSQDVSKVTGLLRARSGEIFRQAFPVPPRLPWWRTAFTVRRLAQASLATAAILLMVAAVVFYRSATSRPRLQAANQTGGEVLRSGSFAILSPVGDLRSGPKEVRWEPVPKATSYRISMLEVDRNELWTAETTEDHVELPAAIQARIVPAKTLFCEIIAVDSSGNKVGDTGLVRFRLLQGSGGQ